MYYYELSNARLFSDIMEVIEEIVGIGANGNHTILNKTKGTLVHERGMENKNFNDVFLAIL